MQSVLDTLTTDGLLDAAGADHARRLWQDGTPFEAALLAAYGYAGRPLVVLPNGRRVTGRVMWCRPRIAATPPALPAMAVVALPRATRAAAAR